MSTKQKTLSRRCGGFEAHLEEQRWWRPLKLLIPLVSLVLFSLLLLWWALGA